MNQILMYLWNQKEKFRGGVAYQYKKDMYWIGSEFLALQQQIMSMI